VGELGALETRRLEEAAAAAGRLRASQAQRAELAGQVAALEARCTAEAAAASERVRAAEGDAHQLLLQLEEQEGARLIRPRLCMRPAF
jgi:hypothetical protein